MTLINLRTPFGSLEFVNGDVGEVLGVIKQAGADTVRIKLDNGKTVTISPNEWKNNQDVLTIDLKPGKRR